MCIHFLELRMASTVEFSSTTITQRAPAMFDRAAQSLRAAFHDVAFREQQLPALIDEFRPPAARATSAEDERDAVRALLSRIPASHLAILSVAGRALLEDELFGRLRPTLGMQLVHWDGRFFATM